MDLARRAEATEEGGGRGRFRRNPTVRVRKRSRSGTRRERKSLERMKSSSAMRRERRRTCEWGRRRWAMMEEEAAAVSAEEERAADLMDLRRRGSTSWDVELVAFSIRAGMMAVDSSSISDISLFSFLSLFVGLIDCCCYYYISGSSVWPKCLRGGYWLG